MSEHKNTNEVSQETSAQVIENNGTLVSRRSVMTTLLASLAVASQAKAAADCSCLPAPDCSQVCPSGGVPRGDGTQACDCYTEGATGGSSSEPSFPRALGVTDGGDAVKAVEANHAVSADTATNATNAVNAQTAQNAVRADYATNSGKWGGLTARLNNNLSSIQVLCIGEDNNIDYREIAADGTPAGSAEKLATPKTIQTNLASTVAASFDGTQNITPGVSGILPIANGGTGNATGTAADSTKWNGKTLRLQDNVSATKLLVIDGDNVDVVERTAVSSDINRALGETDGGPAVSATKLATGRTIQINLATTAAAAFDGTKNILTGVTGILPIANGGTGNATGTATDSTKWNGKTLRLNENKTSVQLLCVGEDNNIDFRNLSGILGAISTPALPVGAVIAFAANSAPSGYLLCNGAAVSRSTYSSLFTAIGTTYGAGDGSTTFNLPNLSDGRFIEGSGTAGRYIAAGLPNITGGFGHSCGTAGGVFYNGTGYSENIKAGGSTGQSILFDASRSSSIYGQSSTVQPLALTMRYYIKY